MTISLESIAVVHSPFREKFATPRQPGLAPTVTARVIFKPEFCSPEAIRSLEGFSHIWLIFLFHQSIGQGWTATVRPPRLGGNQRVGVYASRSPFRPNPIGISAVRLLDIEICGPDISLKVEGADLIDKTPIIDIKPYVPYSDSIEHACGGFAATAPERLEVVFTDTARQQLQHFLPASPELEVLLTETLALDPRPAYKQKTDQDRHYGALLDRYNINWKVNHDSVIVVNIDRVKE